MGVTTGTFTNPIPSTYGSAITGSLTHSYPLTTGINPLDSQKTMARVSGGYSATSASPLSFSGYTILWYNKDINLYIMKQPGSKTATNT